MRMLVDVKALNIHRQVDVKLNELAKQILLLLPLLLLLLLLLRQQYQNLFCQFIQLNIHLPRDAMGLDIPLTP